MIEVPVYNQAGKKIDTLQVDEAKLGGEVRKSLLKQAIVMYHANQRQGTVRTLARGEVAGSTRKIFRQKGTGNARMGTIRQPVRKGGGHAKQKRPKDWRQKMPQKARKLARNSALLFKFQNNDVRVLDDVKVDQPKTKVVAEMYKALGIERSCLVALAQRDANVEKSARNIERTTTTTVAQLNAWDILRHRTLLMTRGGLEALLEGTEHEKGEAAAKATAKA
jgi:large subunit ribosomal protein L4